MLAKVPWCAVLICWRDPQAGKVIIDGKDLGSLTQAQLREERRNITMIFQGFNLLMQRNCLKNVCFPLELAGYKKKEAVERATELLELVGLGEKLKSYPAQLSGGQQQGSLSHVLLQHILRFYYAMKQPVH